MPSSLIWKTAGEIVLDAHRFLGDVVEDFTATSAAATYVRGPSAKLQATDDFYNNLWLFVYSGTDAGDEVMPSDYASTNREFTVAAWTATPDSTSKILLARRFRPSETLAMVSEAIRELARTGYPTPIADASLRVGNILHNGHFENADSGSAVASGSYIYTRWKSSDGWSVQGTSATSTRESTIARNSSPFTQYSQKVISDTINAAYLQWLVPDWAHWAGMTFDFYGWAYTTTGSRVYFRIRDGVNTFLTNASRYADGSNPGGSGTHSGTAGWEELYRLSFMISPLAQLLAVDCYILGTAGGAVTAYFDDVRLIPRSGSKTAMPSLYRIPGNFTWLKRVRAEAGAEGRFDAELPNVDIQRHDDGMAYLHLPVSSALLDSHLLLEGAGYRTDTIAAGTNIELEPMTVAHYAAALMAKNKGDDSIYSREMRARDELLSKVAHYRPNGAVRVR